MAVLVDAVLEPLAVADRLLAPGRVRFHRTAAVVGQLGVGQLEVEVGELAGGCERPLEQPRPGTRPDDDAGGAALVDGGDQRAHVGAVVDHDAVLEGHLQAEAAPFAVGQRHHQHPASPRGAG